MILGSSSPRRKVLLGLLTSEFTIAIPNVDETFHPPFVAGLRAVAERKRDAIPGDVVLAADTIGILDGCLLLKPKSMLGAESMLLHMNNNSHEVWTGVAVTGQQTQAVCTKVRLAIPEMTLQEYLASGDWEGKAGAYGIQHPLIAPHATIDGPWSNVVGLPLQCTHEMLTAAGVELADYPDEATLVHQNPFQVNRDSAT